MDISSLFNNVWSILLVALFFGGSVFVHELGHFLAARRRGVKVERFSIGFGPAICKWRGKDGVEYRLSWLPLGGYVALPQLADMRSIEGDSGEDYSKLPPPSYSTKVIVFVAGAVFNILFALLLSTIIWWAGKPEAVEPSANQIGYVAKTVTLFDGTTQPSPAVTAGLRPGDIVREIDGQVVTSWADISTFVTLGSGRTEDDQRAAVFKIERDGQTLDLDVRPVLVTRDKLRRVGIGPAYSYAADSLTPNSQAAQMGLKPGDVLLAIDQAKIYSLEPIVEALSAEQAPKVFTVRRGKETVALPFPPERVKPNEFGLAVRIETYLAHPNPFVQIGEHATAMYRQLKSWLHPHSDIGLSKFSGPVGIIRMFHTAATDGWLTLIWLTALINVNLALFNLLPLPVLDGGHILFATIAKLRGRPIPFETIATLQSGFMILLLGTVLYVSFFDVRRWLPEAPLPVAPAQATPATGK